MNHIDLKKLERILETEKWIRDDRKKKVQRLRDLEVICGLTDEERNLLEVYEKDLERYEYIVEALEFLRENVKHEIMIATLENELDKL